jgi:hypothetical protein
MKKKPETKVEIKNGDMIYAKPSQEHESPIVGTVVGYDESTKLYAIEWSDESMPGYEKEAFVRSGKFMMKCINEAMGLHFKPEDLDGNDIQPE